MQGKVEICGVNTARLKTLSHSEMDTLLRLAKAGDRKVRERLIEGNLRLVLSVIQRFEKRGGRAPTIVSAKSAEAATMSSGSASF